MGYSRNEILKKCEDANKCINTFYRSDFVNYRGITTDTGEYYSEVVSEYVYDNFKLFNSIRCITRESSYKVNGHNGIHLKDTNRIEEITAMRMFKQCEDGSVYDFIGKIIDYQVPLKNKMNDEAGKIDMLSVNGNNVYIIELKSEDSTETMLRCVLEAVSYLKTVDCNKLLKDFGLNETSHIYACPLVFCGKEQCKEMQEFRPQLRKLIELLNSVPFCVDIENEKYVIKKIKDTISKLTSTPVSKT